VASACNKQSAESPAPLKLKQNRKFGFHITQTELGNYDESFQLAKQAGMEVLPITLVWNQVEPAKNELNLPLLELVNGYYPAQNVSLCLTFTPVYAIQKAVPEDLKSLAWNDPGMIERFKNILSLLNQTLPAVSLSFLSLGNEVDLALHDPTQWEQFSIFYEAGRQHAKSLWGENLPVGIESSWQGLTHIYPNQLKALNQHSDYIQFSYYPLNADFTMKLPQNFEADMDQVLALYPSQKLVLEETGYATSAICQGSEEKQKQYIETIFQWWDLHAQRVPFIGFLWLSDLSTDQAQEFARDYGLPNNPVFSEYLRTTAFRTWPQKGEDKRGFQQLKLEAQRREW
jgi:hypothetical protein